MGSAKRGALIVLEGVDRAGKSTQAKKLVESLNKKRISAELITFPDRTTNTGKLISEYLTDRNCKLNDFAIHLLFTANRWENVDKMKKLLSEGTTLIVDRYSYSGVAFSAAKRGKLEYLTTNRAAKTFYLGISIDWCKHPENGLPKPDLVFLLTLTAEEMKSRPGFGSERYETLSFQEKVATIYDELSDETWVTVDACNTIEDVHSNLLNKTVETISLVEDKPLGCLDFNKKESKKNGNF